MRSPSAVVLGGGLSGMATAYALARAGCGPVTLVERGAELGGLAGTFERDGSFYPLGYHHVLHRDRTLLYFLDAIGALDRVRWRRIRMFFRVNEKLYDLARLGDFLRFPMSLADKLRFARLMVRCFLKRDWSDWRDHGAAELVDRWGGPGVRRAIFEPLARLKFDLPCSEVSAAWLGARLYFREGSAPLGYIPGANWTKVLCDGMEELLRREGVTVRTSTPVVRLHPQEDRIGDVELSGGERLSADVVASTLPTEVYRGLVPREATPRLESIRYSALLSVICASHRRVRPDFYWMNLASLDYQSCGIFLLDSLNPTIGAAGDSCVNFVTHLPGRDDPRFALDDETLMAGYLDDFRRIFDFDLDPHWTHVARVPMYSPVFSRGYDNPPVRSTSWSNVYFAGNYRTFPSVASTGTALASGLEAAAAILVDHGGSSDLPAAAASYRLRAMPRAPLHPD